MEPEGLRFTTIEVSHQFRREADSPGGEAIGVVNLDSTPPQEAIEAINGNENMISTSLVKLPPAGAMPDWLAGA